MNLCNISSISDKDTKDKVTSIEKALDKLDKINGYTFVWKNNGLPSAGVIAQEIKEILPEIISTEYKEKTPEEFALENAEYEKNMPEYLKDGNIPAKPSMISSDLDDRIYLVDYNGVTGFLVAALKEEVAERKKLGEELNELKEKLNKLLAQ